MRLFSYTRILLLAVETFRQSVESFKAPLPSLFGDKVGVPLLQSKNQFTSEKEPDAAFFGKAVVLSSLAIFFLAPFPCVAELQRLPLSEYNTRSLEERGLVERGKFPSFTQATLKGGKEDDELLFPDLEDSVVDIEETGSLFGTESWTENASRSLISSLEKSTQSPSVSEHQNSATDRNLEQQSIGPESNVELMDLYLPETQGKDSLLMYAEDQPLLQRLSAQNWRGQSPILKSKIIPGSEYLEYQQKLGFQNAWNDRLDKILNENQQRADEEEELEQPSFEDEMNERWTYRPDLETIEESVHSLMPLAVAAFGFSVYSYFKFRLLSPDSLPDQYDIDAIERYFVIRPDVVVARALEIMLEFSVVTVEGILSNVGLKVVQSDSGRRSLMNVRARELRESITRLGPAFIKLGQALSSRSDLIDETTMTELALLQDAIPFYPDSLARETFQREIGIYPEILFDWYSKTPVAAASLGQVYKAKIGDKAVAVKIQRPGLVYGIALDCFILRNMVQFLSIATKILGISFKTDLVSIVDEYSSRLFEELDYKTEAANMKKFKNLYGHIGGIYIPEVYEEYSSHRVIVTEWIYGVKVVNEEAKVSMDDLPLLQVGIQCTLMQLLDKGFMHADPHGGNLLKTPSGKLAYIDFGLVSDVPASVMDTIICATVHLMNRAYTELAADFPGLSLMSADDALRELPEFAAELESAFDPIMLELRSQIDAVQRGKGELPSIPLVQIINRIFSLAQKFNFTIPPYFLSNLRALAELEGLAMCADPNFNLFGVIYPYVTQRLLMDPSPRLQRALREFVVDSDGMPRWSTIDQLLKDARLMSSSLHDSATALAISHQFPTAAFDVKFMVSREGAFLRRFLVIQVLSDILSQVNRFIDRLESMLSRNFGNSDREYDAVEEISMPQRIIDPRQSYRSFLTFRPQLQPLMTIRFTLMVTKILARVSFEVVWRVSVRLIADAFNWLKSFRWRSKRKQRIHRQGKDSNEPVRSISRPRTYVVRDAVVVNAKK